MSGPPFVDHPRGPRQNKCLFSLNPWPLSKFIDRKLRRSQVPTTTARGQSRILSLALSLQCPLPTTPCGLCHLHTSPGLSLVLGDSIVNISPDGGETGWAGLQGSEGLEEFTPVRTLPGVEGLSLRGKGSPRMTSVAPWGWWAELPSPLLGGSERGRGAREGAPLS